MNVVETIAPGELTVSERPEPESGSEALVRVRRAGICGTDVKILSGHIPVDYPRVMGHEMVGTVVAAAAAGTVAPGTRVMIDPAIACRHCDQCRRGRFNTCRNGGLLGRDSDGVFSELVTVPEERLHPIADSISDEAASLLQVLGTCVHAQRSVEVFPDQTAVVIGLGVGGQLHVQLLLARGVGQVIGVTRSEWKLDLARRFGATATATPDEAAAMVAELTDGRGADVVVEAAGTERTLAQGIGLAGLGATVVVYGTLTGGNKGLPYYDLYFKELTLQNPRAADPGDYDTGIQLTAEGRLDPAPLVTHTFGYERAAEAFDAIGDPTSLKVVLDFES